MLLHADNVPKCVADNLHHLQANHIDESNIVQHVHDPALGADANIKLELYVNYGEYPFAAQPYNTARSRQTMPQKPKYFLQVLRNPDNNPNRRIL